MKRLFLFIGILLLFAQGSAAAPLDTTVIGWRAQTTRRMVWAGPSWRQVRAVTKLNFLRSLPGKRIYPVEPFDLLFPAPSPGGPYYADFATGADTNDGLSTSTPWKYAKGMANCANVCAGTSVLAGEFMILKANVTWDKTALPWAWPTSGTAGNVITIGADGSYGGAGYATIDFELDLTKTRGFDGSNRSYIYLRNLEFKNQKIDGAAGSTFKKMGVLFENGSNNTADTLSINSWQFVNTDNTANTFGILFQNSPSGTIINSLFENSANCVNNNDPSCVGLAGWNAAVFQGNECHHLVTCYLGSGGSGGSLIDGNYIHDLKLAEFTGKNHGNAIEVLGFKSTISNNWLENIPAATEHIFPSPGFGSGSGGTGDTLIFNNVEANANRTCIEIDAQGNLGSYNVYVFNNTCGRPGSSSAMVGFGHAPTTPFNLVEARNLHYITSGSTILASCAGFATTCTTSNNLTQSQATANGEGYNAATSPPWAVTSATGSTVNAGIDVSSTCPDCASDYSGFSTTGPNIRPQGAAWDIGFTEYTPGGAPPGVATLSLSAITCTSAPYGTAQACGTTLTLQNTGGGNLTLIAFNFSIGVQFSQVNTCSSPLAPSASCTITVTFRPLQVGPVPQDTLTVDTDQNDPTCTFDGTGNHVRGKQGAGQHAAGKHS